MPQRITPQSQPPPGDFRLPPGVSCQKEPLADGWAYMFRHAQLGQLGRLVLHDIAGGRCHVSCEVVGDPADPMTAQRLVVLQPVTTALVQRLEAQTGGAVDVEGITLPPRPPAPQHLIESKMMQCERCEAGVALLIFAGQATDHGGLEDYARLMYPQVQQLNLPTWVIGPPLGDEPLPERPADILKIWPEREPVRRMRPDAFNPIIAALAHAHCGSGRPRVRRAGADGSKRGSSWKH